METAVGTKLSLKNRFEEFKDFGKIRPLNPEIMSQTQCSNPKTCEKAPGAGGGEKALEKSEVSDSKTSISACSCGPECGPDKCDGRNRSVLLGWDSLRTKIFIFLFVAFMVWLVIYVPISLTLLGN